MVISDMENQDNNRYEVLLHIDKTGIELRTFQSNGWMRIDYYTKEGYHDGQTFGRRWKDVHTNG